MKLENIQSISQRYILEHDDYPVSGVKSQKRWRADMFP